MTKFKKTTREKPDYFCSVRRCFRSWYKLDKDTAECWCANHWAELSAEDRDKRDNVYTKSYVYM